MTVVVSFVLVLAQVADTPSMSLTDLLVRSSPLAKAVLLLLLIFSLVSWSIVFSKWLSFKKAERATREFLSKFRARSKLSDVYVDSESLNASPVARLFLAGYDEITNQVSDAATGGIETIRRVLQSATINEVGQMEKSLSWLATTANASPFIGLFGTVVGIVIAFQGLSTSTTTSIQAVAPGIAEALIATAAGIAAAVPAAIFYNHFLSRLKAMTATMDRFSLELLNLVERYLRAEVR